MSAGYLSPESEAWLKGDDLDISKVHVWRGYSPDRDSITYTVHFLDRDGEKRRVDFEFPVEDIVRQQDNMEVYVVGLARKAIKGELENG